MLILRLWVALLLVPLAYHTVGGCKRTGFGDVDQHSPEGVRAPEILFFIDDKRIVPPARQNRGNSHG